MKKFTGTGVALITPFKEDKSVDFAALKKVVQFQLENGVDYLVVLGTTGEYAVLKEEEREEVKNCVIKEVNGQIPLVLGIGGNNTHAVVERLKTENLEGFAAILSVSPYYNKPSQEGIFKHFTEVANASSLPIILYNVPGRTASNMLPETVARLAKHENIIGIKEAAGSMDQAMKMIAQTPKDFLVISGEDMLALPMILAGGAGVISVVAQGFPKEFSKMLDLGLERKVDEAFKIHYQLAPVIDMVFAEGNPTGIKAVFKTLNLSENFVRLPLVEASQILSEQIAAFCKQVKA